MTGWPCRVLNAPGEPMHQPAAAQVPGLYWQESAVYATVSRVTGKIRVDRPGCVWAGLAV